MSGWNKGQGQERVGPGRRWGRERDKGHGGKRWGQQKGEGQEGVQEKAERSGKGEGMGLKNCKGQKRGGWLRDRDLRRGHRGGV